MYLDNKPYIVAELNSSHRGKVEIARQMIDAAKACGCNAVKFQSWTADSLYCKNYYDENPLSKRMVKGFSMASSDLKELADYCHKKEIDFSSTPYSKAEVDFMVEKCAPAFVKIASMDINNRPFLKYIAGKKLPIVLSTGMATTEEIETAVQVIESEGNTDICILHCVSVYPVESSEVNLRNMIMLMEKFPYCNVGYSDHTLGCEVSCAAVGLGASLIEKHFTLDSSVIGWDNQMATEPAEMKDLVKKCKSVYSALGNYERVISDKELEQRKKMRRSIVANHDLKIGHIIEKEDLDAKRPGTGIPIDSYQEIIGRKLRRDVNKDELILEDFIE